MRVSDNAVLRRYVDQFNGTDTYSTIGSSFVSTDSSVAMFMTPLFFYPVAFDLPAVPVAVTVTPNSLIGGTSATGHITISHNAGDAGVVVTLSADPGVTVPTSVTVPAGANGADFAVTTVPVDASSAKTITATIDGANVTTTLTVTPPTTVALSLNPTSVPAGSTSTGTVTLNGAAGPSGVSVALSSNQSFATVPATVTVPAGQTSTTFTANTTDPGSTATATITATYGASTNTANLEVTAAPAFTVGFNKTWTKGGNSLRLTITLPDPAPTGGKTFTLTGNSLTVPPASATIPAGQTSVTVSVGTNPTAVDAPGTVTVNGGGTKTASATILAPVVKSVSLSADEVSGPTTVQLLVLLDGFAPSAMSFPATSSSPNVKFPDANVTVPAGAFYTVVTVTVKKVPDTKSVFLTVGGKQVKLIVQP